MFWRNFTPNPERLVSDAINDLSSGILTQIAKGELIIEISYEGLYDTQVEDHNSEGSSESKTLRGIVPSVKIYPAKK